MTIIEHVHGREVLDGDTNAFTEVTPRLAISELDGLMFTRRGP